MNGNLYAFSLAILLLCSAIFPNLYGETPHYCFLRTDKSSYGPGDRILLNVVMKPTENDKPIVISIYNPEKLYAEVEKLPDENGAATYSLTLPEDALLGTWRVIAKCVDEKAKATFSVLSTVSIEPLESEYKPGDTIFLKGAVNPPSSNLTLLIFDPEKNLYTEKDLSPETNAGFAFSFKLTEEAKPGKWSVQVITANNIQEWQFEVTAVAGEVVVKSVKNFSLISIRNTGNADISSLFIKSDHGSIAFIKAKNWERKRISDNEVVLKSDTALKPTRSMTVMLKWRVGPDSINSIKMPLTLVSVIKGSSEINDLSHMPTISCNTICLWGLVLR